MSQEVAEPATAETRPAKHSGALRFLKELPVLIVLALGIALLIKAFLVQAFYIPSASMEPTLTQGDRVLVNKLSYRFGHPHRGDVIVFRDPYPNPCGAGANPADESSPICHQSFAKRGLNWFSEVFGLPTGDTRDYIKRIVALPGETIAMQHGKVYVCSLPGCRPLDKDGNPLDGRLVEFRHSTRKGPRSDDADVPAFVVPRGEYYVLGDNRSNSSDSRIFHGVPRSHVVGKAFVLVWPPNRFIGL